MTTPNAPVVLPAHVSWKRVGIFYGIALLGPIIVAIGVAVSGATWGADALTLVLGAIVMWTPFLAGWVVERMAGRPHLFKREWESFKATTAKSFTRIIGWSMLAWLLIVLAFLLVPLLGSAGLPGVGHWASQAELDATLRTIQPNLPDGFSLPVGAVIASSLINGLMAGLTINAVFGFGEEYGWRGVLADELSPLGKVPATALVGVLWGLWHAPLIMLGHNYGPEWAAGIPMFCVFTVPLAFILTWVREKAGYLWAPATAHGLFNAVAGLYLLIVAGGNRLLTVPVGIAGAVALAVVAAVLWLVPGLRLESNGTPTGK